MSEANYFDVSVRGKETTVSFSPDTFTRVDSAHRMPEEVIASISASRPDLPASSEFHDVGQGSDPIADPTSVHEGLLENENQVNLDFSNIEKITSAGLNGLIQFRSHGRSHGFRVVLLDVPDSVRQVFELTRLERMFEFENSAVSTG